MKNDDYLKLCKEPIFREIKQTIIKGFLVDIDDNNIAEIWFPYSIEIMKILKNGLLLACKNYTGIDVYISKSEGTNDLSLGDHYSILELTNKKAMHYQVEKLRLEPEKIFITNELGKHRDSWNRKITQQENPDIKIIVKALITGDEIWCLSEWERSKYNMQNNWVISKAQEPPIIGEEVYIITDKIAEIYVNSGIIGKNSIRHLGFHKVYTAVKISFDPEELIRRHFGIFGFTGAGKSNLASTIIRRSFTLSSNNENGSIKHDFLIFDVNNEYVALLLDVLIAIEDSHIIILDDNLRGALGYYLKTGDFSVLDEAAVELYQSINIPSKLERDLMQKLGTEGILEVFKYILASGKVQLYVDLPSLNSFLADLISHINAIEKSTSSQNFKLFLETLKNVIIVSLTGEIERNLTIDDINKVIEILSSIMAFKGEVENGRDVEWDYDYIISFIQGILPKKYQINRTILEKALTIENVNKVLTLERIIDEVAEKIEGSISAKHSISIDGLINILHDNKPSLVIILAESDSYMRRFFHILGEKVYHLRKNKVVKIFPPTLFFLDEADLFIPSDPNTISKEEKESIKQSITMAMTISRRGRKYNLGLGISTQRTRYLNTSIMAQLATYFISKLPRKTDRTVISEGFGIEESFVDQALNFNKGDWLVMSHANVFGVTSNAIPIKVENAEDAVFENCVKIIDNINKIFRAYEKTTSSASKTGIYADNGIFTKISELECRELLPFYSSNKQKFENTEKLTDSFEKTVKEIDKAEEHESQRTFKTPTNMLEYLISQAKYTRKEIIKQVIEAFPNAKKTTLETYISDSRIGSKYPSRFNKRIKIDENGILSFEN